MKEKIPIQVDVNTGGTIELDEPNFEGIYQSIVLTENKKHVKEFK